MIRPEFFDILGSLAFLYVVAISVWALTRPESVPRWAFALLFLIGVAGLLVDSAIVYIFFLR